MKTWDQELKIIFQIYKKDKIMPMCVSFILYSSELH
jgi:hypothetical protein